MILVLTEMLLLDLLEGLSRVLRQSSTAINTLQLRLRVQLLRLVLTSLQRLRYFVNHLRPLVIATKILLIEKVLGRDTSLGRRLIDCSWYFFLLLLFMKFNLFLIFQMCGVG